MSQAAEVEEKPQKPVTGKRKPGWPGRDPQEDTVEAVQAKDVGRIARAFRSEMGTA